VKWHSYPTCTGPGDRGFGKLTPGDFRHDDVGQQEVEGLLLSVEKPESGRTIIRLRNAVTEFSKRDDRIGPTRRGPKDRSEILDFGEVAQDLGELHLQEAVPALASHKCYSPRRSDRIAADR
jgi:hypothetical protein